MKALLPALFLGCLWAPYDSIAADLSPPPAGQVVRASFTTAVKDLEPVDSVSALANNLTRVSYFTEIHGMEGKTVRHRWEFQDKIVLELPFKIGSSHWRIYSTKTLNRAWLGEWKASVVDAAGSSLCVNTFTYYKKPSGATATAP